MEQLILYDNPSRFGTGTCWSPNVWKTRLLLNFKGVDYKTEWIHGPELAPTFKSFGLQAHAPGTQMADYTIPAVRLPCGSYVMESWNIAQKVEELKPTPSSQLDEPIVKEVDTACYAVIKALVPDLVPKMPRQCLSGSSIEFHRNVRKVTFGMTLEELEEKHGGEAAWEEARPLIKDLADILRRGGTGPFCLGKTPCYADFIIVGFLEWCRCLQEGAFERITGMEKAFDDVYTACRPWLERNSY